MDRVYGDFPHVVTSALVVDSEFPSEVDKVLRDFWRTSVDGDVEERMAEGYIDAGVEHREVVDRGFEIKRQKIQEAWEVVGLTGKGN
jgi:hypothetical protein